MLGEVDTTIDLIEAAKILIVLYGQRPGALHGIHQEEETSENPGPAPTSSNVFVHVLMGHL